MALVDFYMQTSGSNLNAGSTSADAAAHTYGSGSLVTAANVFTFTVASGDPQADGVQAGDRVSIYPDGNSVTPFVGTVTSVTSTTIVGASNVNKFGTIPSDGSGTRTLKVGGAWADLGMTASGCALNSGTVPFATRINVKAGTYANTTTARTLALAGATTTPLLWRGYKTAIGDMDVKPTSTRVAGTDIPTWTWGDASLTISGNHQTFENFDVTGARAANAVLIGGAASSVLKFKRVRVENTNAAAGSHAVGLSGATSGSIWEDCAFRATSSATRVFLSTAATALHGCTVTGGGNGFEMSGAGNTFLRCLVRSTGNHGIQTVAPAVIDQCSFYSCGGDGVRFSSMASALPSMVTNCRFSLSGAGGTGYDVNNSTGTNTNVLFRANNLSHSPATGHENGFGDAPTFHALTDAGSPYTNAAGGDFSPASGSNGNGAASPGRFENETTTSHGDVGAVQLAAGGSPDYPAVGNVRSGTSYASGAMVGTLALPAAGDVQAAVTYGAGGTEFTGTFATPGAGNVRSGTGYGAAGTEFTGTCAVPAAADVESGVAVDATTGTLAVPAAADVQAGVSYGAAGTEFTGTFAAPAAGNVRSGVGYGAAGSEFTGTCAVPAAADVESGVAVDATTGTLTLPGVTAVKLGTQYGAGGNEFTGSFIVSINLSLAGDFSG